MVKLVFGKAFRFVVPMVPIKLKLPAVQPPVEVGNFSTHLLNVSPHNHLELGVLGVPIIIGI